MEYSKNKTYKRWLLFILVAGILFRVFFTLEFPAPFLQGDSHSYLVMPVSMLIEDEVRIHDQRPPAYPIFVWLILSIIPDLVAIVLIQHLLGILMAVLLYQVFRYYMREKPGWALAGLAFIFLNPAFIVYEHTLLSDFLLLFLLSMIFYFLHVYTTSPKFIFIALLGLMLGFCILAKPVAMILGFLGILLLFPFKHKEQKVYQYIRKVGMRFFVFVSMILLVVLPCMLYHKSKVGTMGLTLGSSITIFGNMAPWIDLDSSLHKEYKQLIADDIKEMWASYSIFSHDPNRVNWGNDSVAQRILRAAPDKQTGYAILKDLAVEAIFNQPLYFLIRGIPQTLICFLLPDIPEYLYLEEDVPAVRLDIESIKQHAIFRLYGKSKMVDISLFSHSIRSLQDPTSCSSAVSTFFSWFHPVLFFIPFWLVFVFSVGFFAFIIYAIRNKHWTWFTLFTLLSIGIPISIALATGYLSRGMGRYSLPFWPQLIFFSCLFMHHRQVSRSNPSLLHTIMPKTSLR